MKFWKALVYPFEDRRWISELGMALLVAAIPVIGFFIIKGWEFEISVRVRQGAPRLLPGWDGLGRKLWRGLTIRGVGFLYNLPTWAFVTIGVVLWVNLAIRFFGQADRSFEAFAQLYTEGLPARAALLCGTLLYAVAANILYWSGYLRYIETRRFSAFFDFAANIRLAFRNFLDDLVTGIYLSVLTLALGALGSLSTGLLSTTGVGAFLAPILVPALTLTVMSWFAGHLYGQLAIRTLEAPPRVGTAPGSR